MLKLNQFHILIIKKNKMNAKHIVIVVCTNPESTPFNLQKDSCNWTKEKFLQNDRKNLYSMTNRYPAIEKISFLQTLKKNSCKRTKGYLWLNTNDSCEWNARVLEKMFAERIHVVGQKIFLQLDWKDSCNGAERAPAFAERICVVGQKGFLLEEESLHR